MDAVQAQVEAYNARDLEAFVACYAPDVAIEDGEGRELSRGLEQLRADYGQLFAQSPGLHCQVIHRTHVGDYVIDEEIVTGRGANPIHAVAIYRVEQGLIAHVRFLR
jgi:hypothetical protein